jgi:DNA-binding transcriptional LysR family regulator
MDLNSLKIFVDVVKAGSFTAVAKEKRMDPSSVSRTVAALEKELGVRLLQRTTRKLVPTEAGLFYYERVGNMVDEIIAAGSCAAEVSSRPKGTLRITASVAFGLRCIVPLLPEFLRQYSELQVDLLLTDAVVDCLAEKIDVAIRLGPPLADSSFVARKLISTSYHVCASPTYLQANGTPQEPSALAGHNCLRFPLAGFRTRWIFRDAEGKLSEAPVNGNLLISNALAIREAAVSGMGLALLPHWLIGDDLRHGMLRAVLQDYEVSATDFNTAAWLLYPSRTFVPGKVKSFVDFMRRSVPGLTTGVTALAARSACFTLHDRSVQERSTIRMVAGGEDFEEGYAEDSDDTLDPEPEK